MNTRSNQPEAEKTVFENLGMTKEELGVIDEGSGNESDSHTEEGSGNEDEPQRQEPEQDDGLSVRQPAQDKQQPADFRPPPKPFPKSAPVKPDKNGNLVNAQGQIVARAGKEARLYTERHNAQAATQRAIGERDEVVQRLNRAVEIGQELHAENEKLRATHDQVRSLGLEPTELLEAAQLAAEAKRDPLGALKKLLTRAAAAGIDLTQLGMPAGGGIDPKSMMDLIRAELGNQLKPVTDRTAAEAKATADSAAEAKAQREVEAQVRTFFNANPEARAHMPVFQAVLSNPQFSGMSLGEVWARIQLNAMRSGRPLNGNERTRSPSLPNGRGRAPNNGPAEIASTDQTYDQVIRDVLKNV